MQTSMAQSFMAAVPGMLNGDLSKVKFDSSRVAEAAILMGLFVCMGTTKADQAKLPTSSGEVQTTGLGFAVYNAAKPTAAGGSAAQYEVGEPLDIIQAGEVWAFGELAMALGDTVYVRITSDGGSNTILGKVRNTSDTSGSARAIAIPWRVKRASTAAGPVLLESVPNFTP